MNADILAVGLGDLPVWCARIVFSLTLLWATAGLTVWLLRRSSAALRHRAWALSMLAALAMPLVVLWLPEIRLGWLTSPANPENPADVRIASAIIPALQNETDSSPEENRSIETPEFTISGPHRIRALPHNRRIPIREPESATERMPENATRLPLTAAVAEAPVSRPAGYPRLATSWLFILLAPTLWGLWQIVRAMRAARHIVRQSEEIADPVCRQLSNDMALRLRWDGLVRIRQSRQIVMPMCIGWRNPCIILPGDWCNWPSTMLRSVLAHELSHVVRRDVAWQLTARLTCALYWFHPLAWLAAWRMRLEREAACDDGALRLGADPAAYAHALVDLVGRLSSGASIPGAAVAMAAPTGLEQRVRGIMAANRSRLPVGRMASRLFIFAALAVVVATGVLSPWSRDRTLALASGTGEDPKQSGPRPARPDDGLLTLNLTVRMPDDSPAAGARVKSSSQWLGPAQTVRADAAGRVTVRASFGLGAQILVSSADESYQATLLSMASEVRTGFAKPVELVLAPAIDHEVLVTFDDKPVADAQVVVEAGWFHVTGATGRDGVARLKLPAGERPNGVCAWHADLGVAGVWQLDEELPQAKTVLSLHPPAPLTIRVVDAQNKPVPELDICVSSVSVEGQKGVKEPVTIVTQWLAAARVRTNEQGETSVPWAPRGKLNYVTVDRMGPDWKIDEIDEMTPSERLVTVHVRRLKPVTGRLIMPEGTSAEGLLITGVGWGTGNQGDSPESRARRDGTFVINAASNYGYTLGLFDREWTCAPWTGTIRKSDDDDPAEIVLVARRATPLTVRVTRGANRQPVPGACIDFNQSYGSEWVDAKGKKQDGSGRIGGWLKADADGVAHGGIGKGTVTVRVLLGRWDETKTLEVTSDEPQHVEFHRAWQGNRKVIARMTRDGAACQPSHKLKVQAWTVRSSHQSCRIHQSIVRDDQAIEVNFDEEHLSLLAVDPEQGLSGFVKVRPEADVAQLVMQPTANYSGTLIDVNGKPLAGHTLQLETGGAFFSAAEPHNVVEPQTTDASGNFRFTSVAVGVPLRVMMTSPFSGLVGNAFFEPGEVREGVQLQVGYGTADEAPRSLAERLKSTCENVHVARMHAVIVLQGDDSKSLIQLTNRVLGESDDEDSEDANDAACEVLPVDNYLPITVTAQEVEADSAFLQSQNWPRPKANEIVLIAVDGQQQTLAKETINAGDVDSARRQAEEFLTRHQPVAEDAKDKITKVREQARRDGRRVWVILSGTRCGPCFRLAHWIDRHHAVLEKDYVIVKVCVEPDWEAISNEIGGANHGIPWFVITEPDGQILVTSEGPLGNIGMPHGVEGLRHFRKMLEQTSHRLSAEEIDGLIQSLSPRK